MAVATVSLLLPTRDRPALVRRLFQSIRDKSAALDRVEVVLYVDEDDVGSHELADDRFRVKRIIGPRVSMGAYNSACRDNAEGDIFILANDDMVIRTEGWDNMVRELDDRFPDKVYLGYGNDLFKGSRLCAFPILSRQTCDTLKEPFPRAYQGAFIDYHLLDIFKRLERAGHGRICYLEKLVFEHLHYRTGKAAFDETYRKRNRFADDAVFLGLRKSRSNAAKQLRSVIERRPREFGFAEPADPTDPGTPLAALFEYWKAVMCDRELPYRWRGFLYVWFLGRYLASRGYLGMERA